MHEKQELSKTLSASKRGLLALDESVSAGGADPMPSWEAKRIPGAEPSPWDDDDFDPSSEGNFENFDDEDEHEMEIKQALKVADDEDTP